MPAASYILPQSGPTSGSCTTHQAPLVKQGTPRIYVQVYKFLQKMVVLKQAFNRSLIFVCSFVHETRQLQLWLKEGSSSAFAKQPKSSKQCQPSCTQILHMIGQGLPSLSDTCLHSASSAVQPCTPLTQSRRGCSSCSRGVASRRLPSRGVPRTYMPGCGATWWGSPRLLLSSWGSMSLSRQPLPEGSLTSSPSWLPWVPDQQQALLLLSSEYRQKWSSRDCSQVGSASSSACHLCCALMTLPLSDSASMWKLSQMGSCLGRNFSWLPWLPNLQQGFVAHRSTRPDRSCMLRCKCPPGQGWAWAWGRVGLCSLRAVACHATTPASMPLHAS